MSIYQNGGGENGLWLLYASAFEVPFYIQSKKGKTKKSQPVPHTFILQNLELERVIKAPPLSKTVRGN